MPHITKTARYILCAKIDKLFVTLLELLFAASYASAHQKISLLEQAIQILDRLKFFLQILWEIQQLPTQKYILLAEPLEKAGRMLYGWRETIKEKTSPLIGEEENT